MNAHLLSRAQPRPGFDAADFTPSRRGILQRKCACGGTSSEGGECAACQKKKLQRRATAPVTDSVPPIVHQALESPGQPLESRSRVLMEDGFGGDFSRVRVHTGALAEASAQSVNALAYTVGNHIVFGEGTARPGTAGAQPLLAHELAHVLQQQHEPAPARIMIDSCPEKERRADLAAGLVLAGHKADNEGDLLPGKSRGLQRQARGGNPAAPQVGTRFSHVSSSRSLHRALTGSFDGREFVLLGDGIELMRVAAASGRPVSVRPADARACGGTVSESYLNNSRYVGIRDYGSIPEGEYAFRADRLATFTAFEQAQFTMGGHFTDPFGSPMHGGDWGAGRVELRKIRVTRGPCGNTGTRSGFYLHGGSLSGSSGCIDVGNHGIASLLPFLQGFRGDIRITVHYPHAAPSVGLGQRVLGGAIYPGQQEPTLTDRLGGMWRELWGPSE